MRARLPEQYRRREKGRTSTVREAEIREEAIAYASKLAIAVIANLLIEKHGWGSGAGATRLPALIADFEEAINAAGERYGYDCVLTAQLNRLRGNGIELQIR